MIIPHILKNFKWEKDNEIYETDEATILSKVPYSPEILIIGTFNPKIKGNNPEFFYGRNYLWPAFKNIFKYGKVHFKKKRSSYYPPEPTINEILTFCKEYKVIFADMISEILHNDSPLYTINESESRGKKIQEITYLGKIYNSINDSKKKDKSGKVSLGLAELAALDQVNWTDKEIIEYLKSHESIHTVYITRNPTGVFLEKWKNICNSYHYDRKIDFRRIFTPSGQRSAKGNPKMDYIIKHWLNKLPKNSNFEGFSTEWIQKSKI